MNRKELEKMFDERFSWISRSIEKNYEEDLTTVKNYIFETIISEVLKSVMPEWESGPWFMNLVIKEKAKDLYNITL